MTIEANIGRACCGKLTFKAAEGEGLIAGPLGQSQAEGHGKPK